MKIKKINPKMINSPKVFQYFLNEQNVSEDEIFLDKFYEIDEAPFFPIYIANKNNQIKTDNFIKAFKIMRDNYIKLGRKFFLDKFFWYSLFLTKLKADIKKEYPECTKDESKFKNIVLKKFDWENYIFKIAIGAEYISDSVSNINDHEKYFKLIAENLDIYNYILKSQIFRNKLFLIKILDIIEKNNLSNIVKAKLNNNVKVKHNIDIKKDERIGRRILMEFSKIYPVVFIHLLDVEELENYFLKYLKLYEN